jgi:hypothetical protein
LSHPNLATLSIPNNVDATYTGIPLVTITITFYESDATYPSPLDTPEVYPLTDSPGDWSAMSVTAGSNLTYTTILTATDVLRVELDLMASPHGCEEFWYTNIDNDTLASDLGLCGGGVYRELQVYVDGSLAGTVDPYFVLYTGGINPYLWRPLTGIMSFDIPAYKFDLTPFVLSDGRKHSITVRVEGGDSQGGVWYLDAALLLYHNASLAPIIGKVLEHSDFGTHLVTNHEWDAEGGYRWTTIGSHNFSIKSILHTGGNGQSIEYCVQGEVGTTILNQLTNSASVQITSGLFNSRALEVVTPSAESPHSSCIESHTTFGFHINSSYLQDETTFDITASIEMSYQRALVEGRAVGLGSVNPSKPLYSLPSDGLDDQTVIQWGNNLVSSAQYNRTLDHSTVYIQSDTAHGNYDIKSSPSFPSPSLCYLREVSADDGAVVQDKEKGECDLPNGKYVCGYDLCQGNPLGKADAFEPIKSINVLKSSQLESTVGEVFPVRHPLMGKKQLHAATILHGPRD